MTFVMYNPGELVVVMDLYDHTEVICIVLGVASVDVFEDKDDLLYVGHCLSQNKSYYFFDSDIVCLLQDY